MSEQLRLQKYISDCGVMSRRAAEREISLGNITVNDKRVELGRVIDPNKDVVRYNGQIVSANKDKKRYIILNKPVDYLTSMSDNRGRKCVSELVEDVGTRVYPCGRLDLNSEGLLILTNDGELANKLTHPHSRLSKNYHVKINGDVLPEEIQKLSEPMIIDGYKIKPVKVRLVSRKRNYTILGFQLFEGRNRQIRKMCESLDLDILSLRRVSIGPINLGELESGKWRNMTKGELAEIKKLLAEEDKYEK